MTRKGEAYEKTTQSEHIIYSSNRDFMRNAPLAIFGLWSERKPTGNLIGSTISPNLNLSSFGSEFCT